MKTKHKSVNHTRKSQTPPPTPVSPSNGHWRYNGHVARLPKSVRDNINQMLQDGVSYPDIIQRLGEQGKDLKPDNLSQWKKRGYQDWLAEQAFIERTRSRQETPSQLVRDFDGTDVNHAALQLGSLHIFEALRDLRPGSLNQKLGGDCAAFARLLNALARASRETMLLQKYREACARARAALIPAMDPKRKLTESETRAIVMKVDDILGLRSEEDEYDETPNPETSAPKEGRNPNSESENPSTVGSEEPKIENNGQSGPPYSTTA